MIAIILMRSFLTDLLSPIVFVHTFFLVYLLLLTYFLQNNTTTYLSKNMTTS